MAAATRRTPWLAILLGLTMAVALSKFGNPVIFKSMETAPSDFWEYLLAVWPVSWGAPVLAVITILSFPAILKRFPSFNRTVTGLLIAWFVWTLLSARSSVVP